MCDALLVPLKTVALLQAVDVLPPEQGAQSTTSPHEHGHDVANVGSLPPEPGVQSTPSPREDGHVAATVGSLPPEPGVHSTPSPREDDRSGATVAPFPPNRGEHIAPSPLEDGRPSATEATPQRDPNGQSALGLCVDNICHKTSSAPSATSPFEAPTASRSDSQDVRVALRCGYGNRGSSRSPRALRSRSSRKTGRNLPMATIMEECRNIVVSGLHPDSCEARNSFLPPGALPVANEPVGNKRPPGLSEATLLAPICAPSHPDELRRGDLKEQTSRTARAVRTTPFGVDAYQMLPAYMTDVSPCQSTWTSPEPPASPRNVSGTTDATGPGECASHIGPEHEAGVRQETG